MKFSEFAYVDLAVGGPFNRNRPTRVEDVPSHLNGEADCYASIHRFASDFPEYVASNIRDGHPSVSGYDGPSFADFVPFDIDFKGDLEKARKATISLIRFFMETYGVRPDQIRIFFSGEKGFHVLVPIELFGSAIPSVELALVLKKLAVGIASKADVPIDTKIYGRTHLLRLPNTEHSGSGRYKIGLSFNELLGWTVDQIRELAKAPRDFAWEPGELEPTQALKSLLARVVAGAKSTGSNEKLGTGGGDAFVEVLVRNWSRTDPGFSRNQLALAFGGYAAKVDLPRERAIGIIEAVVRKTGDEEAANRVDAVSRSYDRVRAGEEVSGFSALQEILSSEDLAVFHARVSLGDFWAYAPEHKFIFQPTGDLWPAASVNARIPPVQLLDVNGSPVLDGSGDPRTIAATVWLDQNRSVEQMSWVPGEPTIITDRVVNDGGFSERPGSRIFNLYRPPLIAGGDPSKADPWVKHTHLVFPESADHILAWLAYRVQHPEIKINHALALLGDQGTGKDTVLEGAIDAVGRWNVGEVSPAQLLGRFNGFVKNIILRLSEARDLGDRDRYRLYDHLKTLIASPPDVLYVDEKNKQEYLVPNLTGLVITSNYRDGLYIPPDDRRFYVAATELTKDHFTEEYFNTIYRWYEHEDGYHHVAAFLKSLDVSDFNPKAPPPKTQAFWAVVDAGRSPEDAELSDALELLDNPQAVTLQRIAEKAPDTFAEWLRDRKNARQIPHRMEAVGYVKVPNEGAKDRLWKVGGKRQVIYGRRELSVRDRIDAANRLLGVQSQTLSVRM